jgi:hypothetical protein
MTKQLCRLLMGGTVYPKIMIAGFVREGGIRITRVQKKSKLPMPNKPFTSFSGLNNMSIRFKERDER